MTCHQCGKPLTGKQTRWCSGRCSSLNWSHMHLVATDHRYRITNEKLAEVKARFPSCARDWDVAMVDKAWPRLSVLLPRRLERLPA